MSNLEQLIQTFQEDPRLQTLAGAWQADKTVVHTLTGLAGGMQSMILAAAWKQNPRTFLIVLDDKESAAYLQNDLSGLLNTKKAVRFFPDSFKRPMQFEALNQNNVLQRTETVNRISLNRPGGEIIVTYPEALFEQVVSPKELEANRLRVKVGEDLDVDTVIQLLGEFGFRREDFVYEPGQYSLRGGIVDIFSYGNEYPYRIELFDEEVESIRLFDPLNQLSVRNIKEVSIVPNINSRFQREQKLPLMDVLPEGSVVWISDYQLTLDKLQQCFEKAESYAGQLSKSEEEDLAEIFRDRAFIRPIEVMDGMEAFNQVFLGKPLDPTVGSDLNGGTEIAYNGKPQPNFNKNFTLLIEDLNKHAKEGFSNYILTESQKQVERFYSIFEDLDAKVDFHPVLTGLHAGFIEPDLKLVCYTDHEIFQRFHRFRLRKGFSKDKALSLRMLRELTPGDFVTHIDHGVGRYSGLEKLEINGHVQESVRLIYKNNDVLYVSINALHKISKFVGKEGTAPKLSKLGSEAWKNLKRKTKRKVKDIATELIKLYAKRKAAVGHAFPPDGYLQNELEASFIYEDTPDQETATSDVKEDMQKANPMDRLICGDVGFGKTEIAVRAAFKCVVGGKQVAILVPTTILALQHYKTFSDRLKEFGVKVDYINRFRSTKERNEVMAGMTSGEVDIVIGTHALLNKKVAFKDLGLLVIDEEQKFGVAAKEKLRNLKVNVDTLTLTATPIPRTLQFSLMAARDLSILRTAPPNRQPIHTEVRIFNEELVKEAIYYEIHRGGQVFFVHNRVKSLPDVAAMIQRLCPDVDIATAHGQMESKDLEKKLLDFIEGKYDVLVSTNIIETGLDIPNANTMIINNAHQYGMSDLHQLRGRVGRSNQKAFCYLFSPPLSVLTPDARKRLKTLEEFSDLGSGFNIAMRDLDIRGAGNLLGGEQSGFISDIGFETYQKILDEAIQELKEQEFRDIFKEELDKKQIYVRDVHIDTDVEMHIPDNYIESIQERLALYTELDDLEDETALTAFAERLKDRFGPIPWQVEELFDGLRLRWICRRLGFERLMLRNNKLRCFFVENPQSPYFESETFTQIFDFIGKKGEFNKLSLKQSPRHLILIRPDVKSLSDAHDILEKIRDKALNTALT